MNPVETAIGMKREAIAFYRDAAARCSHPAGRMMFQVILEDEERHLEGLERMRDEAGPPAAKQDTKEKLREAFASVKDEMRVRTACTLDEMEAFRLAMEKEKDAYVFYRAKAAEAAGEAERSLFEQLAHEEEEHYRVFSNTYEFLDDSGNWFMWEEHSIVEG